MSLDAIAPLVSALAERHPTPPLRALDRVLQQRGNPLCLTRVTGEPAAAAAAQPLVLEVNSLVGRRRDNTGPLDLDLSTDPEGSGVSARHARLFQHSGLWLVEDLDSTNGTRINGKRLKGPSVLAPDDRLCFGRCCFDVSLHRA